MQFTTMSRYDFIHVYIVVYTICKMITEVFVAVWLYNFSPKTFVSHEDKTTVHPLNDITFVISCSACSFTCILLPVHGNWTPWGKWSTCSASCGQGLTHRRRTCTNPRPSYNGNYCFDDPTEYAQCMVKQCPGTPYLVCVCSLFEGTN